MVAVVLVLEAWSSLLPLGLTEAFGLVTGALSVWLTVKETIRTGPTGIANNVTLNVLFWGACGSPFGCDFAGHDGPPMPMAVPESTDPLMLALPLTQLT